MQQRRVPQTRPEPPALAGCARELQHPRGSLFLIINGLGFGLRFAHFCALSHLFHRDVDDEHREQEYHGKESDLKIPLRKCGAFALDWC
jgi:hypothetical protein